jgi:glycosyltransferase involved in cell wall biosynthesis
MNIAIISPEYPPLTNWGGIATFHENLADLLCALGHRVFIFTYDGKGKSAHVVSRGNITIHYVPFIADTTPSARFFSVFRRGLGLVFGRVFPRVLFILDWNYYVYQYIRKQAEPCLIECIHSDSYHCSAWSIALAYKHIPVIVHLHGPQTQLNRFERFSLDYALAGILEKLYIRQCARIVITCSRQLQKWLVHIFPALEGKSVHIPNFIQIAQFIDPTPPQKNRLVFVGRVDYRKGADLVLDAFIRLAQKHTQLTIHFIGELAENFPYHGDFVGFQTYISRKHLPEDIRKRIVVRGVIQKRNSLVRTLKQLKGIGVLPSRYEPFGFTRIELMAMGYIVVSTRSDSILDGVNGYCVQPTAESVFRCINKLLEFPQSKIHTVSAAATYTVSERYDITTIGIRRAYERIYERLIQLKHI